jgi:hypothetical protein
MVDSTTHALLRHLRSNSFEEVPIPIGITADRETLTWIDGISGADAWAMIVPEGGLRTFARFLRRYHEATSGSVLPHGAPGKNRTSAHGLGNHCSIH